MKIKKYLCSLLLIMSLIFIPVVKAAAPNSFVLLRESGDSINYDRSIVHGSGADQPIYFTNKYYGTDKYLVLCSGDRTALADDGTTYNKTSFPAIVNGAGVAAIIKSGIGENARLGTSKSDIFFTQLAIWKYLEKYSGSNNLTYTINSLDATQTSKLNGLVNKATEAETAYNNINSFAINLSDTSLKFTLDGDTYKSQVVTVSGSQIKNINTTVNIGTVVQTGSGYVVSVPKNLLTSETNTITLNFAVDSNSIPIAANYSNGNSTQQTTTTTNFDYFSKKASKSISGTIKVSNPTIAISKQDATTGKELPGATLILKDENGNEKLRWISTKEPRVIENLAAGKYYLTELIAPDGYVKSSETVTFTVDAQGKLVDGPVVMKNVLKDPVYISKQDATTGREVPGATLILKDSNGKEIAKWVSSNKPHSVGALSAGKYTLIETIAPLGYQKSSEEVTFTVREDGTVAKPVVMKNKPNEVIVNPKTGMNIFGISIFIAFLAFATSLYYYADYKVKTNM